MGATKGNGTGPPAASPKKRGPKKRGAPAPLDAQPNAVLDREDPGDATQRNFRYQHAYGVILLIAATLQKKPYVAIWCEHHEDLLAERSDGKWDGYQVKTRQREQGEWTLGDSELCSAVKHLAHLDQRFPNRIGDLNIVSNARFLDTASEQNRHRSLPMLLRAVRSAANLAGIEAPYNEALSKLGSVTGHEPAALLAPLRKMSLVNGPERESFDAEIAHNHIASLSGCDQLPKLRLNDLRDELVARVYRASSLSSDDPARHWCCVSGDDRDHPQIAAKRVTVQEVLSLVADQRTAPFRYLPGSRSRAPGEAEANLPVLEAKLLAAGLQSQVDTFTARMLAAERRLLEAAEATPERVKSLLDQLESVVKGEYAESLLSAERQPLPYGGPLLAEVYGRLRAVASQRPELVEHEPYETLAGVAAMLTAECQLWWGPRFDIGSGA